jgi:hypothetical protein
MTGAPPSTTTVPPSFILGNGKVIEMLASSASMTQTFVGGIYDPAINAWSVISTVGAPAGVSNLIIIAVSGSRVFVMYYSAAAMTTLNGSIYDMAKDNAFYYLYNKQ